MHERIWNFLESLGKDGKKPESPKEQQKDAVEKSPWDIQARDLSARSVSWA